MLQKLKHEFVSNAAVQTLWPTAAVILIFKNSELQPHPYMLYGVVLAAVFGLRNSIWSLLALMLAGAWFRYKIIPDPMVSPIWAIQNSVLPITFFMLSGVVGAIRDQLSSDIRILTEENIKLKDIQDRVEYAYQSTRKKNDQLEEQTAQEFRRTLEALTMGRADTLRELLKSVTRLIGVENIAVLKVTGTQLRLVENIGISSAEIMPHIYAEGADVLSSIREGEPDLIHYENHVILRVPILGAESVTRGMIEIFDPSFLSITNETYRILSEVAECIEKRI